MQCLMKKRYCLFFILTQLLIVVVVVVFIFKVMIAMFLHSISGCNMLCAFGHPVVKYVLQHVGCCWLKFDHFKFKLELANNTQHVTTEQNACNMLRPTTLQYFTLKCCDRLVGVLHSLRRSETTQPLQLLVYLIS